MYTQCPSCMTVYLLDAATLGASRGDMRCGNCGAVFCALDAIADEPPGDGMITPTFPTASPPLLDPPEPFDPSADATEVDPAELVYFDLPDTHRSGREPNATETQEVAWDAEMQAALRRGQADMAHDAETTQEVEWDDEAQAALQRARDGAAGHDPDTTQEVEWDDEAQAALERASLVEDSPEIEWDDEMLAAFEQVEAAVDDERDTDDEPASEDAADVAASPEAWDGIDPDEVLTAEVSRPAATLEARSGPWRAMTILLTVALCGQTLWLGRDELLTNATTRGWLETACDTFGCTLPLRRDVAQIRLASRDIRPHPSVEGALIVNATLHNQAEFRQPYPAVQIRLSDLQGNPVAARRFAPEEYLERPGLALDGMPPRTMVPLVFEVVDPGDAAVAFEFDFL